MEIRYPHAESPVQLAARYLVDELGWLRVRPESVDAWDELHNAVRMLERVADGPAGKWYAGPCTAEYVALPGEGTLIAGRYTLTLPTREDSTLFRAVAEARVDFRARARRQGVLLLDGETTVMIVEDRAFCSAPARERPRPDGQCGAGLYGKPGAAWVRCSACGTQYDVAERRAWLLDRAEDALLHAAWLASAVTALASKPLPVNTVYSWERRGRIVAHGTDLRGRPLYRVGDALDLMGV